MGFIEYNWTALAWQFRFNNTFTDFRGVRSLEKVDDWKAHLKPHGMQVRRVSKTLYAVKPIATS